MAALLSYVLLALIWGGAFAGFLVALCVVADHTTRRVWRGLAAAHLAGVAAMILVLAVGGPA